jgi:hypothetical protein
LPSQGLFHTSIAAYWSLGDGSNRVIRSQAHRNCDFQHPVVVALALSSVWVCENEFGCLDGVDVSAAELVSILVTETCGESDKEDERGWGEDEEAHEDVISIEKTEATWIRSGATLRSVGAMIEGHVAQRLHLCITLDSKRPDHFRLCSPLSPASPTWVRTPSGRSVQGSLISGQRTINTNGPALAHRSDIPRTTHTSASCQRSMSVVVCGLGSRGRFAARSDREK